MKETDFRVEQIPVGPSGDCADYPRKKRGPDHGVVGLDHGRHRDFMHPILPSPHVLDRHALQGISHGRVFGSKVQANVRVGIQIPSDDLARGVQNGHDVGLATVLLELLIELLAYLVGGGLSRGRVGLVEHRQHARRARALGGQVRQLETAQLADVAVDSLRTRHAGFHVLPDGFLQRGCDGNVKNGSQPRQGNRSDESNLHTVHLRFLVSE